MQTLKGRLIDFVKLYCFCFERMIVEIADKRGGIIVSNDRYKDLYEEKQHWRETILKRVLPFRFMHGQPNEIMFPEDPLGRNGPNLEKFLRF